MKWFLRSDFEVLLYFAHFRGGKPLLTRWGRHFFLCLTQPVLNVKGMWSAVSSVCSPVLLRAPIRQLPGSQSCLKTCDGPVRRAACPPSPHCCLGTLRSPWLLGALAVLSVFRENNYLCLLWDWWNVMLFVPPPPPSIVFFLLLFYFWYNLDTIDPF